MKALMVLTPHEKLGKLSVALLDALGKYRQNATMAGLHLTALLSRRSGSATHYGDSALNSHRDFVRCVPKG